MEEVVFCEGCHRVLSAEYSYCPYCGREQAARRNQRELPEGGQSSPFGEQEAEASLIDVTSFEEIVDDSIDRVQESVREYTIRRLDEFLRTLGQLETDLDAILPPQSVDAQDRAMITASASSAGVIVSRQTPAPSPKDARQ